MQNIAAQLNLSETAFLTRTSDTDSTFEIRYFTPTTEVPFCGHATLAAACVCIEELNHSSVQFITQSREHLSARITASDSFLLNFPLYKNVAHEVDVKLLDAMGISNPSQTRLCEELKMLLIEIDTLEELQTVSPDYTAMIEATNAYQEVVVTSRTAGTEYDFQSRCFCPWIGINEDPVTGAAHAVLAPYWSERLNQIKFDAYQCSTRGGSMHLELLPDSLKVVADAQIVLRGTMELA